MKKITTMIVALFAFAPFMCALGGSKYYASLTTTVKEGEGKVYAAASATAEADRTYDAASSGPATSASTSTSGGNVGSFYAYAKPAVGWKLAKWTYGDSEESVSDAEEYNIGYLKASTTKSGTQNYAYHAYFELIDYPEFQVTFKPVELEGSGSYTVDSAMISEDTVLPDEVTTHVQNFNLVATPASSDYLFVRWYLDGAERETISTDASIIYTATNNVTVGAEFRVKNDVVIHFQPTGVDGVSYKVDNADTISGSVVDKTYERAEAKKVTLTLTGSYSKQPRWWFRTTGSEEKVYWTYAKSPSRTFEGDVDVGVDFFNQEDCNLVAQVGDEPFESLADAVKAWGPGRTLKLLADVTSTETVVVTVNANISSQNWFLELGDHVWTANGCDAIQVYACGETQINQNYGLKVYANQQGGITAADHNCIKCVYDNEATRYRPRIEIYGGEYNGSYVIFYSTATSSSGPNEGCSVWTYAGRDDGSAPVFNGNFALYKCPVNIYSGFFNGNSFHHYIVTSTANVSVYGGSFKNRDAMPKMNGGGGSPKIVFPDNIAIYVDAEGRYNVIPESSVAGLAYEAVSAAYNDTRFSAYMHEVDGQNRYKNFYWADADLAIPNIDKVFYRTITLCENVAATADTTVSTGNANPPCTLDVTAEGASYSGTVKISNSSAKFVIKGQPANVIGSVKNYAVSCSADEENKVYTYSLVSAAASVTVGSTTTYYRTLPDAISAATEAGVTEITILNGAMESPDPAWVVQNGKLVYSPAAAQIGDEEFATFAEAIAAAEAYKAEHGSYPTITVLNGATEQENADWKIADGKLVHKVYIAQIGSAGYETLAAAFAAAVDGDTVTMLDNVTLTEPLNVTLGAKAVTLDLGGKTLAGRTNLKSGSLTIKNGTVAGGSAQALNVYGSADTTATDFSVLTIASDVTVTADVYGVCMFGAAAGSNGYGAVVNIAGTISTTGDDKNGAVFVSGNLGQNVSGDAHNVINVTGKITSATDAAIAMNGLATVNVSAGAEVTGNTAIAVKRGTFNVTGGTIHATGAKNYTAAAYYNGTEMTGAAISVSATYSQYGALAVNVSGGTVTSDNADAIFKQDGTYQSVATVAVSGGYFSSVVPATYCATGCLCTTVPVANGYYQVVPAATVTFLNGEEADVTDFVCESMAYPSGNPAEIALPKPTYTSTVKTFAGWKVSGGSDNVFAVLPAGTTGDVAFIATWSAVKKVQVNTAESGDAVLKDINVTSEWIKDNIDGVTTDEQAVATDSATIKTELEKKDANGLAKWENYVLGQDPETDVAIGAGQGETTVMPVSNTLAAQPVDTGFTVEYSLKQVETNGNVVATVETKQTTDFDIDLSTVKSNAYYTMTATIKTTNGDTVSTVTATNVIGVLAVTNAPKTSIVAVPWKGTDGEAISVSDLVRTATLTPGDTLKAYDSTSRKYRTWTLDENKTWVADTVVGGAAQTAADDQKINRGEGVWLTRQDASQPIYLVGGATANEAVQETPLEKAESEEKPAWNIVASPSVEPADAAELLGENTADMIVIPTDGAPKTYYYNEAKGGWGYNSTKIVYKNGVAVGVATTFKKTDTKVPAGTGFWYLNSSTESGAKIKW